MERLTLVLHVHREILLDRMVLKRQKTRQQPQGSWRRQPPIDCMRLSQEYRQGLRLGDLKT